MTVATAASILAFMEKALAEGWGYVYGENGDRVWTPELAKKRTGDSVPQWRDPKTYFTEDCKQWIGRMVADCSGIIVGAIRQTTPSYGDRTAQSFKNQFTKSGSIGSIPEVPGLAVWRSGHIGIYVGGGYVIEARGTDIGVVKTRLKDRNFTHWGYIKDVDYSISSEVKTDEVIPGRVLYGSCTGNCYLRRLPNTSEESTIYGILQKGQLLLIKEHNENWAVVQAFIDGKNKAGYASTKYLAKVVKA